MKRQYILALIILLLVALPFGIVWLSTPGNAYFSGLLFNPQDGYSYLAKMRQGWEGYWTFDLTYSAQPSAGAPIFLFYLLLGHIARIFHAPLILVFHAARLLSSAFLIWSFDRFLRKAMKLNEDQIFQTLVLGCLGAGLGWVAIITGRLTPDLWVAEMYPFLSMFANPHFPLGLGLMLALFAELEMAGPMLIQRTLFPMAIGAALAIVMPFGFAVAAVVVGIRMGWDLVLKRKTDIAKIAIILIPGGLLLTGQYAAIMTDPVLSQWNSQNLTPSPSAADLLISLLPALILAVACVLALVRNRELDRCQLVLAWVFGCLFLAAVPFGLQRRFLTGLFIPVSILAVIGLDFTIKRFPSLNKSAFLLVILLSLPSNLFTLSVFTGAGLTRDPLVTMFAENKDALDWMAEHLSGRPVCLTDAKNGLRLPAYTPCRVLYGHPFESVPAQAQKRAVDEFFSGKESLAARRNFLVENHVDFLVLNVSNTQAALPDEMLTKEFENGAMTVYRVTP